MRVRFAGDISRQREKREQEEEESSLVKNVASAFDSGRETVDRTSVWPTAITFIIHEPGDHQHVGCTKKHVQTRLQAEKITRNLL